MTSPGDQTSTAAVLASWCDSQDHFAPRKVQSWLAEGDHARMVAAGVIYDLFGSLWALSTPHHAVNEPSAARRVRFDELDADTHEQATVRRQTVNRALDEYYKARQRAPLCIHVITIHTAAADSTQAPPLALPLNPLASMATCAPHTPSRGAVPVHSAAAAGAARRDGARRNTQLSEWPAAVFAALRPRPILATHASAPAGTGRPAIGQHRAGADGSGRGSGDGHVRGHHPGTCVCVDGGHLHQHAMGCAAVCAATGWMGGGGCGGLHRPPLVRSVLVEWTMCCGCNVLCAVCDSMVCAM